MSRVLLVLLSLCCPAALNAQEASPPPKIAISPASRNENGVLVHTVETSFQAGATQIRVVLPDKLEEGKKYRVVYLLPVDAGVESRWGNGLDEAKKLDLHNKFGVILASPTFSHTPWYADHASDARIQQETYFLKVVLPHIEANYPAPSDADGRLLLGFSKSGWGAWSLLLRHPELFARAAAWDAPLMMDVLGKYGTAPIFGAQTKFDEHRIDKLLRRRAATLRNQPRLILTGYENFRPDQLRAHALLSELEMPHLYRDGPKQKHDWRGGWLAETARLLIAGGDGS